MASVPRVLRGESASDAQLAMSQGRVLTASRVAFTQRSLAFVDAFLGEPNAVIAGFMPGPPGVPKPKKGADRE